MNSLAATGTYVLPNGATLTYAFDPRFVCTLLKGVNRVEVSYGIYSPDGNPRYHYGVDIDTPDSDWTVRSTVNGNVIMSTIVTNKSDTTWEWGNFICVLDKEGYRHYFCHLASRSVKVGQIVRAGDVIGVMGKTGNATQDKQAEHVHYEVRKSPYSRAYCTDPTPWAGIPNRQGQTSITQPEKEWDMMLLKSFGDKNMQGFAFTDADGALAYDHMPNGYRLATQRHIKGADTNGWEWVKLLDERTGAEIYTPLLSDRNELIADYPTLVPEQGGVSSIELVKSYLGQVEAGAEQVRQAVQLAKKQLEVATHG